MKTIIYSYENFKPVFYTLDRYYYIKNQRQLDNLIEKLLDIDAVFHPFEIKFPVILELRDGFGPELKIASRAKMKKELNKMQALLNKKVK
jgi:hypothetical protein